ncbi:MAG TPA: dihydrofolate reductase family protein [Solirubrobacteraceae bacterium]|nr:dihydrofolate reductase family protein [Solirubrobacteraceae bacterium]
MARLRFDLSISLDGFIAGPNPSQEHPLGEGGMQLHEWALELAAWREPHGKEGGDVNASTQIMQEMLADVGATIMGRNMFGGGLGPWGDDPWEGWWGDEPPFHVPVFVLTHHAREPLHKGATTFHFVTDGVESALAQARQAAAGRDLSLGGGASVAQQFLAAGLVDEFCLSVVPILLGGGTRLLENLGADLSFEQAGVVDAPGVTHLKYRAVR